MKTVKTVWNIVTWVIVVLAVLVAVLLAGVRLVGIHPYTVLSGSMEPTYHVGSIVYVVETEAHELEVGDPVTYLIADDTVVTHRIVEIVPQFDENGNVRMNPKTGRQAIGFVTKGDANNSADGSLLCDDNVIGKPIFSIPLLGYVADYVQNPPGMYFAIIFACLLLLMTFLPDLLFSDKKEEKDKEKEQLAGDIAVTQEEIDKIKLELSAKDGAAPPAQTDAAQESATPPENSADGEGASDSYAE